MTVRVGAGVELVEPLEPLEPLEAEEPDDPLERRAVDVRAGDRVTGAGATKAGAAPVCSSVESESNGIVVAPIASALSTGLVSVLPQATTLASEIIETNNVRFMIVPHYGLPDRYTGHSTCQTSCRSSGRGI